MSDWTPEREITLDEARVAIAATGHEASELRVLAAGWDNTVVLADETWVFRFPRRSIAVPGVEREITHLTTIAGGLDVPVPVPSRRGTFGDPAWPFWGGRLIPGTELAVAGLADRTDVADRLGQVLHRLHHLDVPDGLPHDPNARSDAPGRAKRTRVWLDRLAADGLWTDDAATTDLLDRAAAAPRDPRPAVLSHGDLYSRHVLVTDEGALAGVIDWGDLCAAPTSVDLAVAYSAFTGRAREAFLAAYGPVDPLTELRARAMALFSCAAVTAHAHAIGDETLLANALTELRGVAT